MIALALLPLAFSIALGRLGRVVLRWCRPRSATLALAVMALVAAVTTGLVLCVVACLGLAEIPALGRDGHWSADVIADRTPVPAAVGAVAGILATVLVVRAALHLVAVTRQARRAGRTRRRLDPHGAGLVVLDDPRVGAYAVPGRRGLVVLSRGLLDVLDAAERRALVAHETAHLRGRHARWIQLAELAAVADPLLRPVAASVRQAVEAWADERAARTVGDARVVARAIAKAALARATLPCPAAALGAVGAGEVRVRVTALLEPRPRPHAMAALGVASALTVAAAVCSVSSVDLALNAHTGFELAQTAIARR